MDIIQLTSFFVILIIIILGIGLIIKKLDNIIQIISDPGELIFTTIIIEKDNESFDFELENKINKGIENYLNDLKKRYPNKNVFSFHKTIQKLNDFQKERYLISITCVLKLKR